MRSALRKILPTVVAIGLIASSSALAADAAQDTGPFARKNFSSTFGFTSDYVFRGISQTNSNWAAQGSFDYTHPSGAYFGIWGSNVNFGANEGGLELDWYGGYRGALGPMSYDVGGIYYSYPKSHDDPEFNFFEASLKLSYTFKVAGFEPTVSAAYNWSPDFFGEDGVAHYLNGKLSVPLPQGFAVAAEIGRQTVEGDDSTDGYKYTHYRFGVSKADLLGFNLDLSYHNTSGSDAEDLGDIADGRLVFTISRTF